MSVDLRRVAKVLRAQGEGGRKMWKGELSPALAGAPYSADIREVTVPADPAAFEEFLENEGWLTNMYEDSYDRIRQAYLNGSTFAEFAEEGYLVAIAPTREALEAALGRIASGFEERIIQ